MEDVLEPSVSFTPPTPVPREIKQTMRTDQPSMHAFCYLSITVQLVFGQKPTKDTTKAYLFELDSNEYVCLCLHSFAMSLN